MKKEKICNQHFVKDTHRNKKYTATIKCEMCEEESNLVLKLPISVYDYLEFMKTFIKLHSMYGCNKARLKVPEWASRPNCEPRTTKKNEFIIPDVSNTLLCPFCGGELYYSILHNVPMCKDCGAQQSNDC